MKKTVLLLLLLFFTFANAQKYNFDYVLTYESTTKTPEFPVKEILHIAVNSSNPDYVLHISQNGFGTIENYKTNEMHSFSIKLLEDGNLECKYLKTYKKDEDEDEDENKKTSYFNSKLNKSGEYKFQIFSNRKKHKVKNEVEIKLVEAPYNLLFLEGDHIYKERKLLISQLHSSLDSTKSYIMESIKINHSDGYIFTCNFISSEKFNIEITVPFNK